MRSSIFAAGILVATGGVAAGQVAVPAPMTAERRTEVEARAQLAGKIRMAVETRLTKNAPYSAEAVTESTQALADGNRIARKTVTRLYRDAEGRTRREMLRASDGQADTISIVDPVGGVSFVLEPDTRTAYRGGGVMAMAGGRGGAVIARTPAASAPRVAATGQDRREAEIAARGELGERSQAMSGKLRAAQERAAGGEGETTKEDLGQQMIEGVMATGTRTTTVIPTGAIGNEQPIRIVSEQWFSPDLELLVLTRHSDPRTGDTTYRLTNIVRGDPDRALFEVPADYTVKESGIRRPMLP